MTTEILSTPDSKVMAQAQALLQEGWALHQQGRMDAASDLYRRVLALQPEHFNALQLLGLAAAQASDFAAAIAWLDRAITVQPTNAVAIYNRGLALANLGRHHEAIANYDKAVALKPDYAEPYNNRGNVLRQMQQHDAAIASYDGALRINPDFAEAHINRANTLMTLGRYEAAIESFDRAILLRPDMPGLHHGRGNAMRGWGRLEAAIASYDKAIGLKSDFADAYNDRGIALWLLGQPEAATLSYDCAIRSDLRMTEAHINRGVALRHLRALPAALESLDRALTLNPLHAGAHSNRGAVLIDLGHFEAALGAFDQALQLQPGNADAHNNRGVTLASLNRYDAALAAFDRAIQLNPDHTDAHCGRANVLRELRQFEAAIDGYNTVLRRNPDFAYIGGTRLLTKMQICDWENFEGELAELTGKINRGEPATPPFPVLALTSSLSLQRKAAEIWSRDKAPANPVLGGILPRAPRDKIRIGYFSMDFRNHPVSYLTAELFESHDRSKFEIIAFSFGPDTQDDMRWRLQSAFDQFLVVGKKADMEIAKLARSMEVDIAVDLSGYTSGARTGIFAMRAAPVQVNYLGYPGTMGAPYIDYIIADETVIPKSRERHYSEKVIYLPCFQANDSKRQISASAARRADVGLPASGFVFCCFNNAYKITPQTFDSWMRILKQVDASVLWLSENNDSAVRNLKREATRRGVNSNRLVFAKRVASHADHLARHRLADLFLDTLPYNAHTTAADALWAGLPVLTRPDEAFASRVAASLLKAVGLTELIVATQKDFEGLAVKLAQSPERLAAIRRKLELDRATFPLFDTAFFTRHIEDAYTQIHGRACAGLPPDHVYARVER